MVSKKRKLQAEQANDQYRRQKRLGNIVRSLMTIYKENEIKLVAFLYDEGYTIAQVARALGVSRQAIAQKYPKSAIKRMTERQKEEAREDHLAGDYETYK